MSKDNPKPDAQVEPPRGIARKPVLFFSLLLVFVVWIGVMIWMWTELPVAR